MERQPGSYIEGAEGGLSPNLKDEAMAGRQPAAPAQAAAQPAKAAAQEEASHDNA